MGMVPMPTSRYVALTRPSSEGGMSRWRIETMMTLVKALATPMAKRAGAIAATRGTATGISNSTPSDGGRAMEERRVIELVGGTFDDERPGGTADTDEG
jgi:hypothetical protein